MRSRTLQVAFALTLTAFATAACQGRPTGSPGQLASTGAESPAFDRQAVANFYQGKTVRFVVGFAPGGGFDTYTRAIGRHIGKHIPGEPAVIVDNMPGGGSLTAANFVYGGTRPDGLTLATGSAV